VGAVADADRLVGAAGERSRDEHVSTRAARGSPRRCLDVGERLEPAPPTRGDDLSQLGQRGHRRCLEARDTDRGPQPDGDGGHLVCVQQERRHRPTVRKAVPARPARLGVDAVAELSQLGDVAAHRALGHAESIAEAGGGDARVRLQQ
jgi:hypothetical protein